MQARNFYSFIFLIWMTGFSRMGCGAVKNVLAKNAPEILDEPDSEIPERKFNAPLIAQNPDTLPLIPLDPMFLTALYHQEKYLMRRSTPRHPIAGFSKKEMLAVVRSFKKMPIFRTASLVENFDFYQLKTDGKNNRVRVTGYYTPRVDARRQRDEIYSYPMLRRPPAGFQMPSLATLRGHALPDSLTAIAWAKDEKEVENAQLQGSCLLVFPNGKKDFLGFGGSQNLPGGGKYVFFSELDEEVIGAGSFPMTAGFSLAIDPKVAPIGSVIFAELPNLAPDGRLRGYSYRILLVQDRGGAIKTTRRVDLYSGIGREGLVAARKVNQFGRFWVLLPKR